MTAIQIPEVNGEERKKEGIPVVDGKKGKGRRVRRKNPRRDKSHGRIHESPSPLRSNE